MLEKLKRLDQNIKNLKRRICCPKPKIEFKSLSEFNTPGEDDVLYVNTTDYKLYIWNGNRYSYETYDQGIRLFRP
jgi:hypothetical protein